MGIIAWFTSTRDFKSLVEVEYGSRLDKKHHELGEQRAAATGHSTPAASKTNKKDIKLRKGKLSWCSHTYCTLNGWQHPRFERRKGWILSWLTNFTCVCNIYIQYICYNIEAHHTTLRPSSPFSKILQRHLWFCASILCHSFMISLEQWRESNIKKNNIGQCSW